MDTQQLELEARRELIADLQRVRTAAWWTGLATIGMFALIAAAVFELFLTR
jgi:hypothetical protein